MSRPDKRQRERARRQRKAERRANRQEAVPDGFKRGTRAPIIDESRRWHMVRTAPRLGRLGRDYLDEALKKRDVAAHRPRASEIVVRRGRRAVRRVPLLIRTLIVGLGDGCTLDDIAALPGVAEVVSHPEIDESAEGNVPGLRMRPARLDPAALQRFMTALASGEIVKPAGIMVGQDVIVKTGPFVDFPGVVEELLPRDRLKVGVSIFGRSSPVELGIADVQAV